MPYVTTCAVCGDDLPPLTYRGRPRVYCSVACKSTAQSHRDRKPKMARQCDHCGAEFTTAKAEQRFCGPPCRAASHRVQPRCRSCVECGASFESVRPAKFCQPSCGWRHKEATRPPRRGDRRRLCKLCGTEFRSTHGGTKFCSDGCRTSAAASRKPPPSSLVPWRECGFCERWIIARQGRKYCSLWCADAATGRRVLSHEITYGDCVSCGALFAAPAHHKSDTCSSRCSKRVRRRNRRHLERSASKVGDKITLRQLAERDGWRCHLCHKRVPDRPYDYRPDDATIDHLVPLGQGGSHTWDNVALAHMLCNSTRNAEGDAAQLRLIA